MPADADAIDRIEQASFVHAGERFNLRRIRYLLTTHRESSWSRKLTVASSAGSSE